MTATAALSALTLTVTRQATAGAMEWTEATDPVSGRTYYYHPETGNTSWHRPSATKPQPPPQPPPRSKKGFLVGRVTDTGDEAIPSAEASTTEREENSSIGDRIDAMILNMPSGIRCMCLSTIEWLGRGDPSIYSLGGMLRLIVGPLVYGLLFVPFVFSVLQQSAMNRTAINVFSKEGTISSSAWCAAFLFMTTVVLYVMIVFSSLPHSFYEPGSLLLLLLISTVIVLVWLQQLLTYRYICMRPELLTLEKDRGAKHKYRLCGYAYSTLNPRKFINYIFLMVVLSEFFILSSVCFHANIPWRNYGARKQE